MPANKRIKRRILWEKSKICFVCQEVIKDFKEASIEHIVPKSLGGTFRMRNLALSHFECNQLRGAIICRVVWELRIKKHFFSKKMEEAWLEKMYGGKEDLASWKFLSKRYTLPFRHYEKRKLRSWGPSFRMKSSLLSMKFFASSAFIAWSSSTFSSIVFFEMSR